MMYILKSQKSYSKKNFIELIGMPASGKSTYLSKMKQENPRIFDVNKKLPKFFALRIFIKIHYILLLFFKSPKTVIRDTRIIMSSKQATLKDFFVVTVNWLFINSICRKYKESDTSYIFIWDQGIFQALWSILLTSTVDFKPIRLFDSKPIPDKVYFFDEDDSILINRSEKRKQNSRLDYLQDEQIIKGRRSFQDVLDILNSLDYKK